MRILITGGNGNIAKIIFKNLSSNFKITLLTRDNFSLWIIIRLNHI